MTLGRFTPLPMPQGESMLILLAPTIEKTYVLYVGGVEPGIGIDKVAASSWREVTTT